MATRQLNWRMPFCSKADGRACITPERPAETFLKKVFAMRVFEKILTRRGLLLGSCAAAPAGFVSRPGHAQAAPPSADHMIRIASVLLELARFAGS